MVFTNLEGWTPYAFKVPKQIIDGFVTAARSRGLKPGERYLVIPAKTLLSTGIRQFYGNAFMVLSFGGAGAILDMFGLLMSDALVDETDPDELEEDEIIVLIKMTDPNVREDGNEAGVSSAHQIDSLKKRYPKHFQVLDLTNFGEGSADERLTRLKQTLEENGKKVKKIVASGHGLPGLIKSDLMGLMSIPDLAGYLKPLKSHFAPNPELHLTACLIAGEEGARRTLDSVANHLLPPGGSIHANYLVASASLPNPSAYANTGPGLVDSANAMKILTPISPTAVGSFGLLLHGAANIYNRNKTQKYSKVNRTDPNIFFAPTKYSYTVKAP